MLFVDHSGTDPAFNLALEEVLFTQPPADGADGCFMLWRNTPAVIIGCHQNAFAEINPAFVRRRGIRVLRRLTGGGAVYHDAGNLNYTFILPRPETAGIEFHAHMEPVRHALLALGVPAEFSRRSDLAVGGRKISGTAQHLSRGRLLHHGTLLFDADLDDLEQALRPGAGILESKGVASIRSRVTNIAEHLAQPMTVAGFRQALLGQMRLDGMVFRERPPTAAETVAAQELVRTKYGRWDWNFGQSPAFTLLRTLPAAAGPLKARLDIREGRIHACHLDGGGFGGKAGSATLAAALTGCRLDADALASRLETLSPETLPAGIPREELLALLTP